MGRAARPVRERRRVDADAQGEARGGDEELRRGDRRDVRVAGEVRALRPERWRRLGPGGADELLMTATSARTADDARRTAGHVASRVSGGKTSTMYHTVSL